MADDLREFDEAAEDARAAESVSPADQDPIRAMFEADQEPAPRPAPEPERRSEPEPAKEMPDMVPYEQFQKLVDANRRSQEMLDQVLRSQLGQNQQPPPRSQDVFEGLPDEDRELGQNLLPVVQRILEDHDRQKDQQLRPLIEYANEQRGLDMVKQRLQGFDRDVYEEAKSRWNQMGPEDQAYYGSPAGLEALGSKILRERERQGSQPAQTAPPPPPTRTNRAHTVPRGTGMEPPPPKSVDPWKMNEEEFDNYIKRLTGGQKGSPNEPDSFLY